MSYPRRQELDPATRDALDFIIAQIDTTVRSDKAVEIAGTQVFVGPDSDDMPGQINDVAVEVATTDGVASGLTLKYNTTGATSGWATADQTVADLTTEDVTVTGSVYINDTANANAPTGGGLTVAAAGGIGPFEDLVALKAPSVAHGVTNAAETDTFGSLSIQDDAGTAGGLMVRGYTEAVTGVEVNGVSTTENTARAATATGAVMVRALTKSGTGTGNPGAETNLFVINAGTGSAARWLVDAEGDTHYDGVDGAGAWDDYDDVALLTGLRASVSTNPAYRDMFQEWVAYAKPILERTGVVTYNADGHHFVSTKGLNGLLIDALRQVYARCDSLERRQEAVCDGG